MTNRLALVLLAALAGALMLGAAPAQEGSDPEAYLPYLFAAFALTWLAFFAYLFFISRKERGLRREVEALRQAIEDREQNGAPRRDE